MEYVFMALVCLGAGIFVGRYWLHRILDNHIAKANRRAEQILKEAQQDAETLKKNKVLEAKEEYLKLKTEFESEAAKKKNQIINNETKLKNLEAKLRQSETKIKQKELALTKQQEDLKQKYEEADSLKEKIQTQLDLASLRLDESEKLKAVQSEQLEKIAGLKVEEAREQLIETIKEEARARAAIFVKQIQEEAKLSATKEAKKLIITTIQRTAAEQAIENCVSIFHLESDEIKGKIIGREGRNIRALEAATGVELIVDDTPEAIVISGFDPVRREIARLALHRLVADGRIHPARIEEVVAKTTKNMEEEILEIGEKTVIELGIHNLHPELIKMVGRMRFRSSYGQNLLQHSKEVANMCAIMASELGFDSKSVKYAKRAGLLHDIGKVWYEETERPHALVGMDLAQKYKEKPVVCNAIGAHHDEIEMTNLISPIVQACDAISGSRPGARREMMDSYIQRLQNLETLAQSFKGVNKCFAMQAGRELRVIVDAENVSDEMASQLSFDISQKIEKEMQYPGQIKITVIREKRAVAYAK